MNLLINAAEAIGDAPGRIAISAGLCKIDTPGEVPDILRNPILPGEYVRLEVCDSGCGMDEDTQARIFEPFFTTKFTGRGLGLAAVHGIVRAMHGAIGLTSAPGAGATFRIHVPATLSLSSGTGGEHRPELSRRTGRILVIDDEEMVRTTARIAL